jgi:hypothetical protein
MPKLIECKCDWCKNIVYKTPYDLKRNPHTFCKKPSKCKQLFFAQDEEYIKNHQAGIDKRSLNQTWRDNQKLAQSRPDVKAKHSNYRNQPEVKKRFEEIKKRPEVRAKNSEYHRKYSKTKNSQ